MAFPPHALTPSQLARLREVEREGAPFVALRDLDGELVIAPLDEVDRFTVGRGDHNLVRVPWDPQVSRTHAEFALVGHEWTVADDGLSRNGTFVNGERLTGRRRLDDGDTVRVGAVLLLFRAPGAGSPSTVAADAIALTELTPAQRRVLVALCRPLFVDGSGAVPASNREIAEELHLSLDGVKTHVRALFTGLGIDALPQYRKRTELARRALDLGLVGARDYRV